MMATAFLFQDLTPRKGEGRDNSDPVTWEQFRTLIAPQIEEALTAGLVASQDVASRQSSDWRKVQTAMDAVKAEASSEFGTLTRRIDALQASLDSDRAALASLQAAMTKQFDRVIGRFDQLREWQAEHKGLHDGMERERAARHADTAETRAIAETAAKAAAAGVRGDPQEREDIVVSVMKRVPWGLVAKVAGALAAGAGASEVFRAIFGG